jgi:hypothetical protein
MRLPPSNSPPVKGTVHEQRQGVDVLGPHPQIGQAQDGARRRGQGIGAGVVPHLVVGHVSPVAEGTGLGQFHAVLMGPEQSGAADAGQAEGFAAIGEIVGELSGHGSTLLRGVLPGVCGPRLFSSDLMRSNAAAICTKPAGHTLAQNARVSSPRGR